MSRRLISRSPDLTKLREDGYDIAVLEGHLVVRNVPYVAPDRQVKLGVLVSTLHLAGDVTAAPDTHVVSFAGEAPCDRNGKPLDMNASQNSRPLAGVTVAFDFSRKPTTGYPDYYAKMTTYAAILENEARAIDAAATARPFLVVEDHDDDSPFNYIDSASARSQITAVTQRLKIDAVAIVGLGGTGSYVLDYVAKTPVREIHLFDGDVFGQHNAFRTPGAASIEQLRAVPAKVEHFASLYGPMRAGIREHPYYLEASNLEELRPMDFVFLCLDKGEAKKAIVAALEAFGVPFIDVGMGLSEVDGSLQGVLRVTTSTPDQRGHVHQRGRIPFSEGEIANEYTQNIQIAELNALNAALAVIRWKRLVGFYLDLEREYFSTYQISDNSIVNDDCA